MKAYVIGLRLTCDSLRKALKLTVGAWKPANTNSSDKIYVCMLDVALQKANSMVSFYDTFQKYTLRHWLKNAQRAVNNFIDYSKCLLQPIKTISFVNVKLTFKILPNTMSVFQGVKNDLSGDLCKSGPGHFASKKKFSLKLCPINYLW